MTDVKELDIIAELAIRLEQLINKAATYNIPRTNFSEILENERLLAIYHKEFAKVYKSIAYIKELRQQSLQGHKNNPQLAIDNMKKSLKILVNLTNIFSPNEILRLRKLIIILDKSEIDEIHKCIADVQRWINFALRNREQPYRMDFFFNRLVTYIRGGFLDGAQFLGLYNYFRDAELTEGLLKNKAVRRLRMYKKQIEFFRMATEVIKKALKSPGWEGFLGPNGFYRNLTKGKKYIKMVRKQFENERFAAFLERLHEKIHEKPEVWERDMELLSKELNNSDYQNSHVIYPAMQDLLALFQMAIDRVSKSEIEFKQVDKELEKLLKDMERRLEKLKKEIATLRKEFDSIDNPVADEMAIVMPALFDYVTQLRFIPERKLIGIFRTLGSSLLWLRRYGIDAKRFLTKGNVPIGAVLLDASNLDKLELGTVNQINASLFNQPFVSYIGILEARFTLIIIPQLIKIVEFIRKYENQFTIPISNTTQLLPEVQELLAKAQDKLIAEFKEAGIDLTKPLYG